MADFVQLQQVLLNLVMNAIESMTTVTDRPRVLSIQSLLHDLAGRSAVLVAVSDSGVGLSTEGIARVFEAFYTTKPEGMGMGLWICRSIIEAHDGQLMIQPNDGTGGGQTNCYSGRAKSTGSRNSRLIGTEFCGNRHSVGGCRGGNRRRRGLSPAPGPVGQ
jgi:signal transduction histidine kinase